MSKRCYYEVLGVGRECSIEEIKGAYRKLAKEHHPDRNPDDKSAGHKFREVSEAYEVLKDNNKRAAYDRFGHAAFEHGGGGAPGAGFPAPFPDAFDDLFAAFMGAGGRRDRGQKPGGELRDTMEL